MAVTNKGIGLTVAISTVTQFSATYASAFQSVASARRAVGEFAATCGFGSADVSDIVLAVGEACSNAVEHGHAGDSKVAVSCIFDGAKLRVQIADHGCGFDHHHQRPVLDPAEFPGRGRGITIMRALMDGLRYKMSAAGTTVVLEKRLVPRRSRKPSPELRGLDAGNAR